jgi:Ca2+-binding EF-hand superfamily protein
MKTFLQFLMMLVLPAVAVAQFAGDPNNVPSEVPPGGPQNALGGPGQPGVAPGPSSNAMFAAIDADADGVITKNELRKAVVQLRKLDTDGDGNLTLVEVSPPGGAGPVAATGPAWDPNQFVDRLMENDKNGDGKLTADEVTDTVRPMIEGADQNGDGVFERAELAAHVQNMHNRSAGGPGRGFPGDPGALRGPGNFADQPFDANQMTAQLMRSDRNRDGRLTPDEVPQQAMGMLRGGDQNNDGAIDAREMQIIMRRMGSRARALGPAVGPNGDERAQRRGESRRNRQRPRNEDEAPAR